MLNKESIKVEIFSISKLNFHCCKDLRIVWVIEGNVELRLVAGQSVIHSGELEIININEPCAMKGSSSNKILLITIDGDWCRICNPNIEYRVLSIKTNCFFDSDVYSIEKNREDIIESLKSMLVDLIIEYRKDIQKRNIQIDEKLKHIILFLLVFCDDILMRIKSVSEVNAEQIQRYMDIDTYMLRNISHKITLDDLASLKYISSPYLSFEFKRKFKKSFSSMLKYYRTVHAVRCLLDGNCSIGDAIKDSGFSNDKYFYRAFNEEFGCSPKEFRKGNSKTSGSFKLLNLQVELDEFILNNFKDAGGMKVLNINIPYDAVLSDSGYIIVSVSSKLIVLKPTKQHKVIVKNIESIEILTIENIDFKYKFLDDKYEVTFENKSETLTGLIILIGEK